MNLYVLSVGFWIVLLTRHSESQLECKTYRQASNYITAYCINFILKSNEQLTFSRTDLYCIIFKNSSISVLRKGVFDKQSLLKDLRISDSKLCFIEDGALDTVEKLAILQLDGNCINEIRNGIFTNQTKLNFLDLSRNNISVIQNGALNGLGALQTFVLSSNQLTVITNTTFSALTDLHSFDLSKNKLSIISEEAFSKLSRLDKLIINRNLLEDHCFLLKIPSSVTYLDLSYNKLNKIASTFSHLGKLNYLDLSHNSIIIIETNAFTGATGLQLLNLESNSLKQLCESCFILLTALQHLYLSNNSLQDVSFTSVSLLENLEVLTLHFNQLSNTRSNFLLKVQFPKLKTVTLNDNAWVCNALEDIADILANRNISLATQQGLMYNKTNIYGIRCYNFYTMGNDVQSAIQGMEISESNSNSTAVISLLVLNTILLSALTIFHIMKYFCRWRMKFGKRNSNNVISHEEFEVVNDLYSTR